jgi:hypothetical protein
MGKWSTASRVLNLCERPVSHHDRVTPVQRATGAHRTGQGVDRKSDNLYPEHNPVGYLALQIMRLTGRVTCTG